LMERGYFEEVRKLSNSTPQFTNGKEAEEWLKKNEEMRLTTIMEYNRYVKTGDRRQLITKAG